MKRGARGRIAVELVLLTLYKTTLSTIPLFVLVLLDRALSFVNGSSVMMQILFWYAILVLVVKTFQYIALISFAYQKRMINVVLYVLSLGYYGAIIFAAGALPRSLLLVLPALMLIYHFLKNVVEYKEYVV